uniref:Uncharacterized protein n=1 Tax=Oryza glumipatula TaxID=40148 RepID=A0A0E0AHU6_9ORYZ
MDEQGDKRNCNPQSSHTTYLQAISVVTASKSSTVYVSVKGNQPLTTYPISSQLKLTLFPT